MLILAIWAPSNEVSSDRITKNVLLYIAVFYDFGSERIMMIPYCKNPPRQCMFNNIIK